ncbi:MAG: hypothetical protein ACRDKV_09780 [Solirubrobacterales bacterium]
MRKAIGRARPSPAMVVAVIALVAALGGAAVALPGRNSVRSNDIKPKNVRGSDIRPRAVDPFKTNLMRFNVLNQTVSTTSNQPVDLGGPNVTVKVPKGALVQVFAEADMQVIGGGPNAEAQVRLFHPTILPNSPQIIGARTNALTDHFTAPGPGNQSGVNGELRGGWLVFSAGAGRHTFSLRYSGAGGGTALFANPKLYIAVVS